MNRIETKSLQSRIVDQVGQAILDGEIPHNSELTQVSLALSLGVSRMPVREALFILEHQGLVTRLSNNHCLVTRPDQQQVQQILALCERIEADVACNLPSSTQIPTDEQQFHQFLCEKCENGYPRRVLVTTTSVYVSYAIAHAPRETSERRQSLELVQASITLHDTNCIRVALHEYFSMLLLESPF